SEEFSYCQSWQTACPSLRRAVFLSQTEWMFQEDDKYVDVSFVWGIVDVDGCMFPAFVACS
ncbi:hypothetical protein EDB19DRAFT_1638826, partial [Suillus lakei]